MAEIAVGFQLWGEGLGEGLGSYWGQPNPGMSNLVLRQELRWEYHQYQALAPLRKNKKKKKEVTEML